MIVTNMSFLEDLATQNKLELNNGKTEDMWIGFTRSSPAPPPPPPPLQGLRESKSTKQYSANNLLYKDKIHTGICGINLGWLTILPKGGYRKSTKSLFRYHAGRKNRFALNFATRCKVAIAVIASNLQGCKYFGKFRNQIMDQNTH